MTKCAWRQIVRYLKDLERLEGVTVTDAAPESKPLYDETGRCCGINVLFSCTTEPRGRKREPRSG